MIITGTVATAGGGCEFLSAEGDNYEEALENVRAILTEDQKLIVIHTNGKVPLGAESAVIRSLGDLSSLKNWIDAGAHDTFVADCRITSSVRAPWLTEWMNATRAAQAAVTG